MKFFPPLFRAPVCKVCVFALTACLGSPCVLVHADTHANSSAQNLTSSQRQSVNRFDAKLINEDPSSVSGVVNINAATIATLATELKGIGPTKAAAIVLHREQHGAFATVDALVNVKGIGAKTLEKLRKQLTAGPYKKPAAGESLAEQEAAARAAVQSVVQRSLEIRRAASERE